MLHLAGLSVVITLAWRTLWRGRSHRGHLFSLFVFLAAASFQLAVSSLYHLQVEGGHRGLFQRLDHAAIFGLIAGTFTPNHSILFKGWKRWGPLVLIWLLAFWGIALKLFFFERISEGVGLGLYLGMGWLGIFSAALLWRRFSVWFLAPLLWGALSYTLGAVLEFMRWPDFWPHVFGPHEFFHLFVLMGITWHWHFIHHIAVGMGGLAPGVVLAERSGS
jgi:channel protein (hemolysin III family)